jgi:hypothetical protein
VPGFQLLAKAAHTAGVCVFFGSNSEDRLKRALKMKYALPEFGTECGKSRWLIEVQLDESADVFNKLLVRISGERLGAAAQACAKSSDFGLAGMGEEAHILAPRPLGWTRGAAIHAGGGNRKHKFPIASTVPRKHSLPKEVV